MLESIDAEFDELLPPELVVLEGPPAEPGDCVSYLLDQALAAGFVTDRADAMDSLGGRDAEPTAAAADVAVLSAKTEAVRAPRMVFSRSETGIEFESTDEPAALLFLLLLPADGERDHRALGEAILEAVERGRVDDDLRAAETTEDVRAILREALAA